MIADKIKNARTILYYITTVRLDFFQIGIMILFSSIVLVRHSTKLHSTKQSEELSVIAMMSSFCTVMNLMCYFLILAVTRLDIHLQQECVKLE